MIHGPVVSTPSPVDGDGSDVVVQAGSVLLLVRTAEHVGLIEGLSKGLAPSLKPMATQNLGEIVLDVAIAVATSGDCAADIAQLRCEPEYWWRRF